MTQEYGGLKLSVIIPTHNRMDIVVKNLLCLARQTLPADSFEVLVCDDASTDGTWEALQSLSTPYALRLFRLPQCGGPGRARNLLIREARAEALVILNDDALLTPAGLAMHAAALEMTRGERIAVLGRFSFPADYQRTPFGCLLEHTDLSFRFPLFTPGNFYGANAFYSCNLGIYAEAVAEAGYFDEGYAGAGAEDMELGDRLAKLGNMVVYLDKCVAVHEHRLTVHDFCRSQIGRGGGGVVRCMNDFSQVFHYDDMDTAALERLRRGLHRAEDAVLRLKDAVHALHRRAAVGEDVAPQDIPWRGVPLRYSAHDQWRMPPRAVEHEAQQALADMVPLLKSRELSAGDMGALYQVCSFLKWRYDTVGISRSPWIDEYAARKAERQASRQAGQSLCAAAQNQESPAGRQET